MKGMVFTEFLEMVENEFGWELVDDLIEENDLPSGGAYTAVGTYDHAEMVTLVTALSEKINTPVPDLLKIYGRYLFNRFSINYAMFFEGSESAFDFLLKIEDYIHVEVHKLYPEAELPHFTYETTSASELVLIYESERPFADFAEGLIQGCIQHFNEDIQINRQNLNSTVGTKAKFSLSKRS